MEPSDGQVRSDRTRVWLALLFRAEPTVLGTDVAVVPIRIALVWIFMYYGAGKLFGWFNGPGIHRTAIYFADTAHLHPGGFFAVLGGLIEFGAAIAMAFGFLSRLAGLALFGDMVMAMITVSWKNGINSLTANPGYEFNLALAAMALVIVGLGAGRLSVDAVIARRLASTHGQAKDEVAEAASPADVEQSLPRADPLPR